MPQKKKSRSKKPRSKKSRYGKKKHPMVLRPRGFGKATARKPTKGPKKSKKKRPTKKKSTWVLSVKKARKQMKAKGFVPIGGRTAKGRELLRRARAFHGKYGK